MNNEAYELCAVVVLEREPGFVNRCVRCHCDYSAGKYAVAVLAADTKFLVGFPYPPICCGEEKRRFVQLFDTAEDAMVLAEEVQFNIRHLGTAGESPLLEVQSGITLAAQSAH